MYSTTDILKFGCSLLKTDTAYIGCQDEESFLLEDYYSEVYPQVNPGYKTPFVETMAYHMVVQNRTYIEYNFECHYKPANHVIKVRRGICTPISTLGNKLYVLGFVSMDPQVPEFTQNDVTLVELFAKVVEQTKALKDKEHLYRLIYENNPTISHVVDHRGIILNVNNLWEQAFGYSRAEVIGVDIFNLLLGISIEEYEQRFSKFNQQGYLYNQIIFIRERSGMIREMEASCAKIDHTNPLSDIYVILTDVTRSKQVQRKLDYLWNCSTQILVISSTKARFLQTNAAFSEILGYSIDDLKEHTILSLVHPDDYQATLIAWQAVVTTQKVMDIENRFLCKDGTYRWLLWRIALPPGQVIGSEKVFAIIIDIHKQRLVNEELLYSQKAALEACEAKSHFIANVSHELRTPLNSIIGFANLLAEQPEMSNSKICSLYLERITKNSMHLLKLIESILDISKIENGSSHLEISQVCLNQLILDTVQEIGGQALEKSLSLSYIIPPKKFRYMTDLFKLKQVIINLLGNAIKFTDEGYVKIELVWDESTDRPLSIQILDTGIGIKEDKLPKLFDKFYQVDKKYNRRHSGTGLGLYISKQLCILLNLELTVSSEFQKGSCFTITFPNPPKVTHS